MPGNQCKYQITKDLFPTLLNISLINHELLSINHTIPKFGLTKTFYGANLNFTLSTPFIASYFLLPISRPHSSFISF